MSRIFVPEGRELREPFDLVLDHLALALEELGDGSAKARVRDPMSAVGRHRQVAALDLVWPLRACLDPLQPVGDGKFDGLVIAAFEMEKLVISIASPVPAVDRVLAEEIERA